MPLISTLNILESKIPEQRSNKKHNTLTTKPEIHSIKRGDLKSEILTNMVDNSPPINVKSEFIEKNRK